MSGDIARGGFIFQDTYLLKRLLEAAAGRLDELWKNRVPASWCDHDLARFGIEAKSRPVDPGVERPWDIFIERAGRVELIEVKSGELSRDDFRVFWSRLRREPRSVEPNGERGRLIPVLVVDPQKAGGHLEKLRQLAAHMEGIALPKGPIQEPGNIRDVATLAAHAIWGLCGTDSDSTVIAWSPVEAKAVLSRLEIHEHPAADLQTQAEGLLGLFFDKGLEELKRTPLLGWLAERAVATETKRRFVTIRDLLAEMEVLGLVAAFDAAILRAWREAWDNVGIPVESRTAHECRLGQEGVTVALSKIQPEAEDLIEDQTVASLLVLGPGGAGKSVVLRQLAERVSRTEGDELLWCGAADVKDEDEIDLVERACRFRASVLGWRDPEVRLHVLVDALDEAEPGIRVRWAKTLARLAGIANLRLLASVRAELWRRDEDIHRQLGSWRSVELRPWPKSVVDELLAQNKRYAKLSARGRELLRTPILLDVFWRTFVEGTVESGAVELVLDDEHGEHLETRHGLIGAFWERRLLKAPRYQGVRDFPQRLLALWECAAATLGSFTVHGDLEEVAVIATSEGILVWSGRPRRTLEFRHLLLRDFALAQWCMGAGDEAGAVSVAERWRGIVGGVSRRGVLRALLDYADDERRGTQSEVVQEIAKLGTEWAEELAQFLGTREARAELDPAFWRSKVHAALPASFGASLLKSARRADEASWANRLSVWAENSGWLDEQEFPGALVEYAKRLAERAKHDVGTDGTLRESAVATARYLRRVAEWPRFHAAFHSHDAWLCGRALGIVSEVLPDIATLAWAERELTRATGRIRWAFLESVGHLARADASRAAEIYRQAVGLHQAADGWRMHRENWQGFMSQHVLEWSLGGENRHIGLLREFPAAFFPVAIELIEALWRVRADEGLNGQTRFETPLIESEACGELPGASAASDPADEAFLWDDGPAWLYWRGFGQGLRPRATKIVHREALAWAERDPVRFVEVLTVLRRSRQSSVQGLALDLMEEHRDRPEVATLRRMAARDLRLYRLDDLLYWAGRLLEDFWQEFLADERAQLIDFVRAEIAAEEGEAWCHARYFLARLAENEWPEDLRQVRPKSDDDWSAERRRLRWSGDDDAFGSAKLSMPSELFGLGETTPAAAPGKWAESWDHEALARFYRLTQRFSRAGATPEEAAREFVEATALALDFLREKTALQVALEDPENAWMLESLSRFFNPPPKPADGKTEPVESVPPQELVRGCAELALAMAEKVPDAFSGELPDGDSWSGWRETTWTRALRLADQTLVREPVREDETLSERLFSIVETVFTSGEPMPQMICVVRIWPCHWARWRFRGETGSWLVWRLAKHPMTIRWALNGLLGCDADAGRVATMRHILGRQFEVPAAELAGCLGEHIGMHAIAWSPDGRSQAADLADEILDHPERFPLLAETIHRRSCWRGLVFGLKEQAKHTVRVSDGPARDYGRWVLAGWRKLRELRDEQHEARRGGSVVLHAMYWLGESDVAILDVARLRPWWVELRALLSEVAEAGSRDDCFALFYNLCEAGFIRLATVEGVLGWGETFAGRFRLVEGMPPCDLGSRSANGDGYTWREVLGYAASAVGAWRAAGLLNDDAKKERARALLAEMNRPPLDVPEAGNELHRLYDELG